MRPGVAVPKLSPPFAAAAHRVLCVSNASVGRSAARLTAEGLPVPGPASPTGRARPADRRRRGEEERALTDAGSQRPTPKENRDCPREPRPGSSLRTYSRFETPSALGPSRPPSSAVCTPSSGPAPSAQLRYRARSVKTPGNPLRPLPPAASNGLGLLGQFRPIKCWKARPVPKSVANKRRLRQHTPP